MGLNNQPTIVFYPTDGTTRDFVFNFSAYDASYIKAYFTPAGVQPNDSTQLLTQGAGPNQYGVTLLGDNGGSIRVVTAPAAGGIITIARAVAAIPTTDYGIIGNYAPNQLNTSFNSILMCIQQNLSALLMRTPQFQVSGTYFSISRSLLNYPIPGSGQAFRRNSDNTAWEVYTPTVAPALEVSGLVKQKDHPHKLEVLAASPSDVALGKKDTVAVTPQSLKHHPSLAKAWVVFNGNTMQLYSSHNLVPGSLSRDGVGRFSFVPNIPITGMPGVIGTCCDSDVTDAMQMSQSGTVVPHTPLNSKRIEFICRSQSGSPKNFGYIFVQCYGI